MNCVIEILYPEFCNLFGDMGNVRFLKKCLPDAQFIETKLHEKPYFLSHKVSLVYMAPMSESTQEKVIGALLPYREEIHRQIDGGTSFLVTGNALEVFGKTITDIEGKTVKGLGIFNMTTTRDMMHRFSSLVMGNAENVTIVGFRAQFTKTVLGEEETPFFQVDKGYPMGDGANMEGVRRNHFIGTYLLGPMLILNPLFTKKLLQRITGEDIPLAFEEDLLAAYDQRLREFRDKNTKIH